MRTPAFNKLNHVLIGFGVCMPPLLVPYLREWDIIIMIFCCFFFYQCLVKNQSSLLNNSRAQSHGDNWSFHDRDSMYLFKKVKRSYHCEVILLLLLWHSILMNLKLEIKENFYISNALIKNYLNVQNQSLLKHDTLHPFVWR